MFPAATLAKMSKRPGPHEQASGPEYRTPPNDSQPPFGIYASLHRPSNHLCQRALLVPFTNISILPFPHDAAVGSDNTWLAGGAPNDSQPPFLGIYASLHRPSYHL